MEEKDPGCQRYEERAVESLRGMKKETWKKKTQGISKRHEEKDPGNR